MYQKRTTIEYSLVALFWAALLTLVPLGFRIQWPEVFWIKQLIFAGLLTGIYYLNKRYILPPFYKKHNFWVYALVCIGIVLVTLILLQIIDIQLGLPRKMHEIFNPDEPYDPNHRRWRFDYSGFLITLLDLSLGISIFLVQKSQEEGALRRELEKLQISTELSYLKAQINPHFFFNTLNNIYSLTSLDVEASRKAILKLSAMMRYVIYERKSKPTSLAEEIEFIENYIELMKLRLSKRVSVIYDKPDNPPDLSIAPMILLPFVENAFKHGVSSREDSRIYIKVEVRGNALYFEVENTKVQKTGESHEDSGIGISNTRRRLELLYPDKHDFELDDQGDTFIVRMRIELR